MVSFQRHDDRMVSILGFYLTLNAEPPSPAHFILLTEFRILWSGDEGSGKPHILLKLLLPELSTPPQSLKGTRGSPCVEIHAFSTSFRI